MPARQERRTIKVFLYALYGLAGLLLTAAFLWIVLILGAVLGLWPLPNER
jgi:hypothetical protein